MAAGPGIRNETLLLDLVEWVAREARPYDDVMEAWRTSCPRFPVWEDATDMGLVVRDYEAGRGAMVRVTSAGLDFLKSSGRG
jgi:hypothetical protein